MRCPKCQKEMETGYLGSSEKGMLIWAEKKYFDNKLCNFFTKRDALKHGAINIRVGNGLQMTEQERGLAENVNL